MYILYVLYTYISGVYCSADVSIIPYFSAEAFRVCIRCTRWTPGSVPLNILCRFSALKILKSRSCESLPTSSTSSILASMVGSVSDKPSVA